MIYRAIVLTLAVWVVAFGQTPVPDMGALQAQTRQEACAEATQTLLAYEAEREAQIDRWTARLREDRTAWRGSPDAIIRMYARLKYGDVAGGRGIYDHGSTLADDWRAGRISEPHWLWASIGANLESLILQSLHDCSCEIRRTSGTSDPATGQPLTPGTETPFNCGSGTVY